MSMLTSQSKSASHAFNPRIDGLCRKCDGLREDHAVIRRIRLTGRQQAIVDSMANDNAKGRGYVPSRYSKPGIARLMRFELVRFEQMLGYVLTEAGKSFVTGARK